MLVLPEAIKMFLRLKDVYRVSTLLAYRFCVDSMIISSFLPPQFALAHFKTEKILIWDRPTLRCLLLSHPSSLEASEIHWLSVVS